MKDEFNINLISEYGSNYDGVILVVAHKEYTSINIRDFVSENGLVYDVKSLLDKNLVDGRL